MKNLGLLLLLIGTSALASATRTLDGAQITNGAATLTLPTTTDTMVGRTTTDTLTNKSLSGSSNTFTNIPTTAIAGSALSGSNTGDVTIGTANGLSLTGQALSLAAATSSVTGALTSTDWSTFNAKFTLPTLTAGSVLFSDGTTIAQDNSKFKWDDTNFRFSIGGHLNTATLGISDVSTSDVALDVVSTAANTAAQIGNQGAQYALTLTNSTSSATQGATLGLAFSRGTTGSRTAVQSGDEVGVITGQSYNGASFGPGYNGAIGFVATEAQTSSHNGGEFLIETTANGSLSPAPAAIFNQDQTIQFNHYTTNGYFKATGTTGTVAVSATIPAGTDLTGQVPVANGGTGLSTLTSGSVLVGAGTSSPSLVAPGTSGNVLTSNGSTWVSQATASAAPALNGGSGSAESVTAAGGITLTGITYANSVWVAGSSGAVTVTKTPSITACTADGQKLQIAGTSNTNTVTLQDQANLTSSGLSLNGNWVGAKDSTISLHCDITQGLWVEDSRR